MQLCLQETAASTGTITYFEEDKCKDTIIGSIIIDMANQCDGREYCVQKMYIDCTEIQPEAGG
jgi:hypothetical protein